MCTPKPSCRNDRKSWSVTIAGKRHNLGPDRAQALKAFHEPMAQPSRLASSTLIPCWR